MSTENQRPMSHALLVISVYYRFRFVLRLLKLYPTDLRVVMASGKWERVGKGGKPANKCTGQHKNTKDSDKPLSVSMVAPFLRHRYGGHYMEYFIRSINILTCQA